jgi:excisionase family DNA binding protein
MGEDQDTGRGTRRRLSVSEAADELGVTVDAIRSRIKRGTITHIRRGGRVWVILGADQGDRPGNRPAQDQVEYSALTSELRDRLRYVEGQLEAERQAHAESRRLLMAALERIPPQLESAETVEDASEGAESRSGTESPQEGAQRPWWRRLFGS